MIRIGIVGCGYWGPLHVRVFSETPGVTVTTVADLSAARLAQMASLYPDVKTTTDVQELLEGPVDAVVIATPAGSHARLTALALEAGKHALVEKPLASTVEDAEFLAGLAARLDRRLMAGHTFLYHAAVRRLRELIDAGEIGDLYYVDAKRVNLGLHRKDVDVVWDLAAHDVAILRYLLGSDALAVSGHGANFHGGEHAEVAYLNLGYADAVFANLHVSWLYPAKVRRITVVGSRRMVVWNDLAPDAEKLRVFDRGLEREPYYNDFGEWQVAYRSGDGVPMPVVFQEPLRLQAAEFVDAIREGREPLTSAAEGLAVVRTLAQASAAMRVGRGLAGIR